MRTIFKSGIGLLELMLSLVIIALLLVMATRYYATTRLSQEVSDAAAMVLNVYSAGENWLQANNDFSGVSMQKFVANGSVPDDFVNPNANPWGGGITVAPATDPSQLQLTMDQVPETACKNLLAKVTEKISNTTGQCTEDDPATLTLEFTIN